jgi:cytochrome bd-type quinol oxidase subunit 2
VKTTQPPRNLPAGVKALIGYWGLFALSAIGTIFLGSKQNETIQTRFPDLASQLHWIQVLGIFFAAVVLAVSVVTVVALSRLSKWGWFFSFTEALGACLQSLMQVLCAQNRSEVVFWSCWLAACVPIILYLLLPKTRALFRIGLAPQP